MVTDRDRYILISVLKKIKVKLTEAGWLIVDTPSPVLNEVYITEGFQEKKITGNVIGVAYSDISDPLPVELGNPKLKKISRTIGFSVIGQEEAIAANLTSTLKAIIDGLQFLEIFDENQNKIGTVSVGRSRANRLFPVSKDEWRQHWWALSVETIDYIEI